MPVRPSITFDKTMAWLGRQFEAALDDLLGILELTLAGGSLLPACLRRVGSGGTDHQSYSCCIGKERIPEIVGSMGIVIRHA